MGLDAHRIRIPLGSRTFSASWAMTLLTVLAIAGFMNLGRWQWNKGNLRAKEAAEFAQGAGTAEPLAGRGLEQVPRFQRVSVQGRLDPTHQFLLDNRTNEGRPGYEVLTPLERGVGQRVILVDRGWVPFTGFRDKLPDVSFAGDAAIVIGFEHDGQPDVGHLQRIKLD